MNTQYCSLTLRKKRKPGDNQVQDVYYPPLGFKQMKEIRKQLQIRGSLGECEEQGSTWDGGSSI